LVLSAHPSVAEEWNWSRALHRDRDGPGAKTTFLVLVGARVLDSDDWAPVEVQPQVGLDLSYTPPDSPLSYCTTLLFSEGSDSASDVDVTARILELQVGARKVFRPLPELWAYGGGGGSVLQVHYDLDPTPEAQQAGGRAGSGSSTGWGLWAGGGAYYRLGKSWLVGADARYDWAPVGISDARANAGGVQISVTAGYRWAEW
jgi:hypothetical protein